MRSITDLIFRLCKTDLFCIRWHRSCLSKEPVQHHDGMKNPVLRPAMDQLMLHWIIETGSTSHLDSTIPLNMAKAVGMLFKSHPAVIQSLLKKILQQVLSTATSTGGSASKSSNTCIKAFILISKMNYNKASKDALPPTYILDQILQTGKTLFFLLRQNSLR